MAVFKHGNEGTFFQKEKIFFRKAWFLAQFHGDSEGAFSVSSFFQRNSGGFCRFSDCIWGGKKNPKNSGAFCLFQMNRWRGQFFVRGIPQKFFGVFVSYRTWWWGDFFEIKKLCLGPALYVKQFLLIFFRGKRPFFRLYMRGHFLDWYFFEDIPGQMADFKSVYEGTFWRACDNRQIQTI